MIENKRFTITGNRGISDHHKKRLYDLSDFDGVISVNECLNELEKENKELQERNNRQAKQLDELYHLIKDKDWRTLTNIVDDFKKAEEQLQKEWKCYE